MFAARGERILDDALLEEMQFAGARIGALLDGRDEQRVQLRVLHFHELRDVAVVRLPARVPFPNKPRRESRDQGEQRRGKVNARISETERDQRHESPANRESPHQTRAAAAFDDRGKGEFEHRCGHVVTPV